MTAFLIFFLATYSAMHLFVFWHAKALLPDRWLVLAPAILFLALMVVAPIAVATSLGACHPGWSSNQVRRSATNVVALGASVVFMLGV